MNDVVIIAPHCDDELIGCYSILKNEDTNPLIIYTEPVSTDRQTEAMKIREHFIIKGQMFCKSIPMPFMKRENIFYFPGPEEIHPAHRKQASIGEELARQGYDVIFYSTNMNVPYIREVKDPSGKKEMLDLIYLSQTSLWATEHKYILFEGFVKWLF